MSNATLPYEKVAAVTFPKVEYIAIAVTVTLDFKTAKPFLSGKPLRRPARTTRSRDEADQMDIEASRLGKVEPGTISLDDLKKELGL